MVVGSHQAESIFNVEWILIEKRKIWLWQSWFFILWVSSLTSFYLRWESIFAKIISLAKKEKALFIQIETINYFQSTFDNIFIENIHNWYYKKFITPYTAVINLERNDEEILSNMKPKWRYNIKLAVKKWVLVQSVEKNNENIEIFLALQNDNVKNWEFKILLFLIMI